jgi:serine/threonine protein kinase
MGTTRTCSSCGDSVSGTLDHCPKDGAPFFSPEVMSRVGMVLRDHEIQGVIGEGGMGVVYRAQHVVIEKPVAIKVLFDRFAKQKDMVEQFIVEAKAASRVRHPNIIDVTDFGTTPDGMVFLIMEYLDGESLQERLSRVGRLPTFEAVNIVKQIARGLGAAHELGIVHRDLKPANIFLCQREGRRRIVRRTTSEGGPQFVIEPEDTYDFVKLLDFGVAKFLDLGPSAATRAGVLCGTPHYLSPEQAQEQSATERSDLYSLGAVFYEMVTGSVPYDGNSMFEILKGHVVGDLVLPSRRAPDAGISPQVDAVIARCLEKEPARRFASTDQLCDALSDCVGERAFLRDAHRLPGIAESGLDLSEGTSAARRDNARPAPVIEDGFSKTERESAWADLAEVDERPKRRGSSLERRETIRIAKHRTGPVLALIVLLLGAAGGGAWLLRDRFGFGAAAQAPQAKVPALVAPPAPIATKPAEPGQKAEPPVVAAKPAEVPIPSPSAAIPTEPSTTNQEKERTADKARPRSGVAAPTRMRFPLPSEAPAPLPPSPVVVAPAPAPTPEPAPAPTAPAVDVDKLLREAQQAWSRQYYGVAIDKAQAVLKAAPGRHDAYQIIAVCSCAIGAAADAREAVSHLDAHKQKLVQSLCKNHGVSLE